MNKSAKWKSIFFPDGTIKELIYKDSDFSNVYLFYPESSPFKGPRLYIDDGEKIRDLSGDFIEAENKLFGSFRNLDYVMKYDSDSAESFKISISVTNRGSSEIHIFRLGLKLGIDCCMESHSRWNDQLFPTLLRCEKTHFISYLRSPGGKILGVFSPDPVASWSLDYNKSYYGTEEYGGHRINSINLELLHSGQQPERHPEVKRLIPPGETLSWTINFVSFESLGNFPFAASKHSQAPFINVPSINLNVRKTGKATIYGENISKVSLLDESGSEIGISVDSKEKSKTIVSFKAPDQAGYLTLKAESSLGKISEAIIYVRTDWSWYVKRARKAAWENPQKASTHVESWMGYFSAFIAGKYFPDPVLDESLEKHFHETASLMFDFEEGIPIVDPGRIQNTSMMISLLVSHYKYSGRIESIRKASRLADWLQTRQDKDGSFRAGNFPDEKDDSFDSQISNTSTWVHYTCVTYIAKSVLELALMERTLGASDSEWRKKGDRHLSMVLKAIEDLKLRLDNIGTEGQATFEDGMISCSALQMGMTALVLDNINDNSDEVSELIEAAKTMIKKHSCLVQQIIPDARMRGGTIRFWEAQYDIYAGANFITTPHGWTSWKSYAYWYIYLLTGEIEYLEQLMDSIGAAMQQVSLKDGSLNWAFQVDPYVNTSFFEEDPNKPSQGERIFSAKGECYHPMISSWWRTPENTLTIGHQKMAVPLSTEEMKWTNKGGCCDNDVHEHFKCLEETALTRAYVYSMGSEKNSWNAKVRFGENVIDLVPNEEIVDSVHFNIDVNCLAHIHFASGEINIDLTPGFYWVYKDGTVTKDPFLH